MGPTTAGIAPEPGWGGPGETGGRLPPRAARAAATTPMAPTTAIPIAGRLPPVLAPLLAPRPVPIPVLIQRIIAYFNIIWDDAEEVVGLARISHPRIAIDTSGLSPRATELANRLSNEIGKIDEQTLAAMLALIEPKKRKIKG